MGEAERLYTPELLGLTLKLGQFPLGSDLKLRGAARSKSCGSTLEIGISLDDAGRIFALGIKAQACAVGQAAAAIFAEGALGLTPEEIREARSSVDVWLKDDGGNLPDWPGIDPLVAARTYPGRHGAIMLAWNAAVEALS